MQAPRHIGIDLHRNQFTCCVRLENGRNYLSEWKLEDLWRFTRKLRPSDEIAVEVTGNTRLFHDAVAPHVSRVVAVDPNQFKVISHSVKKTDPNDARNLALYLEKDLLPEVRMKDKTQAQLASLAQTRDTLVKLRTALKGKINNILSAHGINLKKEALSSEKQLNEVLAMSFDPMVKLELEVMVDEIRSLNQRIAKLEKAIGDEGSKREGHKNLTSIKGIGPLSGSILLSVIGDIHDFADEGKLAAYFGIVPRVSNSNETERSGRITKRGSKLGRTTLVQCALIAQRYSPYLKRYYEKVKARRGTGKAIIALARKLLGIIYRTLKNNWIFADFPNFVLAVD
jgi:transposase